MTQPDPILPVLADDELSERAAAVFDDIRATRNTDFVNNIWRVLANDPNLLEQTWSEVKNTLTEDSELDVFDQAKLIYIAVSVAQNCNYCIRSHTAAARALGLTDAPARRTPHRDRPGRENKPPGPGPASAHRRGFSVKEHSWI